MNTVFLTILNMSITASYLVLAVVVLRFLLKKAPKAIHCVLWGLVGLRLLLPLSIESLFSLIPSAETVPLDIVDAQVPTIQSGMPVLNQTVNPIISHTLAPASSMKPIEIITSTASILWIAGIIVMLTYMLVSFLCVRSKVRVSLVLRDNVLICDNINTPFILGILKPKIYLPSSMDSAGYTHVVAHEQAHLQRRDHWWKPLGFLLLCVYWFNPMIWLAYILLCRDIELACDEKVVQKMGVTDKKAYSTALLSCSVPRRIIAACPLAFGEIGVKERVKLVLHYKKPAFWITLVAILTCIIAGLCFLTNPKNKEQDLSFANYRNAVSTAAYSRTVTAIYCPPVNLPDQSSIQVGVASGTQLASYLDNRSWQERNEPRDHLPSPGSVEFVLGDEYRITVYQDSRWVKVRYHDEIRYYRAQKDDYDTAVSLIHANEEELFRQNTSYGYVAVSGLNFAPAVQLPLNSPIQNITGLSWLDIEPAQNAYVPFEVLLDGNAQYGWYNIYDAETCEALDFIHPSGLDPQTFILQNAVPGRSYIVTLQTGSEEMVCFGIRIPVEPVSSSVPVIGNTVAPTEIYYDWGIHLTAEDVSPHGMTLVCTQNGGVFPSDLFTGTEFWLEISSKDGSWEKLPVPENLSWDDLTLLINKNDTARWTLDWEYIYGQLDDGIYQIGKNFFGTVEDEPVTQPCYATFQIGESTDMILAVEAEGFSFNLMPGEILIHPYPIAFAKDSSNLSYHMTYTNMACTLEFGLFAEDGTRYINEIRHGSDQNHIANIPAGVYYVFVRSVLDNNTHVNPDVFGVVNITEHTGTFLSVASPDHSVQIGATGSVLNTGLETLLDKYMTSLLNTIISSPAQSSSPGAYIDAFK